MISEKLFQKNYSQKFVSKQMSMPQGGKTIQQKKTKELMIIIEFVNLISWKDENLKSEVLIMFKKKKFQLHRILYMTGKVNHTEYRITCVKMIDEILKNCTEN